MAYLLEIVPTDEPESSRLYAERDAAGLDEFLANSFQVLEPKKGVSPLFLGLDPKLTEFGLCFRRWALAGAERGHGVGAPASDTDLVGITGAEGTPALNALGQEAALTSRGNASFEKLGLHLVSTPRDRGEIDRTEMAEAKNALLDVAARCEITVGVDIEPGLQPEASRGPAKDLVLQLLESVAQRMIRRQRTPEVLLQQARAHR